VTIAWQVARIAAVIYVLGYVFEHLPPASIYDTSSVTIPDVLWDPFVAVLHLGRLLPITTLLALVTITLAIQTGLILWWIGSWVLRHVLGGS
jgi:hypothetical protein